MVLEDVSKQLDVKPKVRLQLHQNCSARADDEQVLSTHDSRENAVEPQAERVEFQPYLARPGLKDGPPVVLVEQLSRGIGPHFD